MPRSGRQTHKRWLQNSLADHASHSRLEQLQLHQYPSSTGARGSLFIAMIDIRVRLYSAEYAERMAIILEEAYTTGELSSVGQIRSSKIRVR